MVTKIIAKEKAGFRVIVREIETGKSKSFTLSKDGSTLNGIITEIKGGFQKR